MAKDFNINTWEELTAHCRQLEEMFLSYGHLEGSVEWSMKRTDTENRCLHLYCQLVADELNERGITFTQFFEPGFEVPWTKAIVKENVWRPVQRAVENVESTKDLIRGRPGNAIYDVLTKKLSEYGIYVPWPSKKSKTA